MFGINFFSCPEFVKSRGQEIVIEKKGDRNDFTGCSEYSFSCISDITPGDRKKKGQMFGIMHFTKKVTG